MRPAIETLAAGGERAADRRTVARRLLAELRPFRASVLLALGFAGLSALAQAGGPWLIGRAIDHDILQGDSAGLARTMLMLALVYGAGYVAMRFQIRLIGTVGQQVLAALRERLFARLLRLPLGYFD